MNTIGCPFCGTLIEVPDEVIRAKCYKCGKPITVGDRNTLAAHQAKGQKRKEAAAAAAAPPEDLAPVPAQAAAEDWYFSESPGEETGPVSFKNLRLMAREGMIGPDTLVRQESQWHWKPAAKIPGLFST
jgi:hypothetical protein